MSISSVPLNQNLSQPSKFILSFDRLPYLTFFCTRINIPGINFGTAVQQTPFIDAPVPGDKMVYDPLGITFLVDEQLWSWTTVFDWIRGVSFPENFDQYKNLTLQQKLKMRGNKPQYSDAMLTILSNKNNPILQIQFSDVFPIALSTIEYDVSLSALNVITSIATFNFTNYDIIRTP